MLDSFYPCPHGCGCLCYYTGDWPDQEADGDGAKEILQLTLGYWGRTKLLQLWASFSHVDFWAEETQCSASLVVSPTASSAN
jgi:hypothetical protein